MDDQQNVEPRLVSRGERIRRAMETPGLVWLLIVLAMMLLALAIFVFGSSAPYGEGSVNTGASPSAELRQNRIYTVVYRAGVFSPTNLRIHAGDTVRFKNESLGAIWVVTDPHPEHSALPGFDSIGDIPIGSYFAYTFSTKGVFGYHNEKNINETGTIIAR